MQFAYKVIDERMAVIEGRLEAVDYEAAKRIIRNNGWQLVALEEPRKLDAFLHRRVQGGRVKYESVASLCSQLAMMIRSGANLVKGLEILQSQMEDRQLKHVLEQIIRGVSRGDSLSQAMRDCRGALPELLINLVAVGEESGSLESVLTSMAEYYERENFIRKKINSAAIYPLILTFVMIGLAIFFLNFILPEIQDLITQNGQQLPVITQMILKTSDLITSYGFYWLGGLVILSFLLSKLFQQQQYRYYLDQFLLKLPLFGKNLKNVILARFARTLALFLHSSIPIVPILNSIENIVGNEVPRQSVFRARERIIQGEPLALAFGQEPFFDPMVIQMMSIGEETGRLEELMGEIANHYDKRVEIGISRMVALVEPIFTLLIGIFAGGLIISIALPIFNMANVMNP
jgi:type IV pilus assembly protein PilC